mmetsp:Transcript_26121/g.78088  ORF Transcript_26121/g.78088 Transcript_26121/m.78088 type:complete len:237 (+) Transcript_26121:396-1106(+)
MVHKSKPMASTAGNSAGCSSKKYSGFATWRGDHSPLYSGLSISGACHLPTYLGLAIMGGSHLPQPTSHAGLSTIVGSHSPSSASSQSVGFFARIWNGASSSQPSGFRAVLSMTYSGASSSPQSSGFLTSGSSMSLSSTQSEGLVSVGSSTSSGGFTGGFMLSSSDPEASTRPSIRTSKELSARRSSPYRCVRLSLGTAGGSLRCFSSHAPVTGLLCLRMKCTLSVGLHLSGPNMMT